MKLLYTGRQVELSPATKSHAEERLQKIHKILGARLELEAHLVIVQQHHRRYMAEITCNVKNQALVCASADHDLQTCLQEVLDKLEKQAIRYRDRGREIKRRPKNAVEARAHAVAEGLLARGAPADAIPPARTTAETARAAGSRA